MRTRLSRSRLRNDLVSKIEELSGVDVMKCYQCGKCSAGCPMASEMDILPSEVIRLIQLGDEDFVNCKTVWLCASCFTCSTRCPKGIDLPRLMEAVRLLTLRKNIDHIKPDKIEKEEIDRLPQIALVANFRKSTA